MSNSVFWYVDGMPTKGMWVDMNNIDGTDEVLEQLVEAGYCAKDYGGDLLAADAEGLCRPFLGNYGLFELDEFVDCRDAPGDEDAKAAYVNHIGSWSRTRFEDAYMGEFEDDVAFASYLVDETGMLNDVPDEIQRYFDYESYARDLMVDHFEEDGFYFRSI